VLSIYDILKYSEKKAVFGEIIIVLQVIAMETK
jgi:hypothetical protein